MAIRPPNNQKNAIPTRRGWIHPTTGELLVAGSISQKNIDAYMDSVQEEVTITVNPEELSAEDYQDYDNDDYLELDEYDLEHMSKKQLIETAEEWEVDIDKKSSVDKIRQTIAEALF